MKLAVSRVRRTWWLAGGAAVACSALVGWHAGGRGRGTAGEAHARLAKIVHGGADTGTGVIAVSKDGRRAELPEGSRIAWGTRLETSAGTRARLELDDGTAVAMDRATALVLDGAQTLQLPGGAIVADVSAGGALLVSTGLGAVRAADARFAMTADDARTSVEVARGDVDLAGPRDTATVHAGEEGDVGRDAGRVEVTATTDLAQRVAFGEGFDAHADDDGPPAGLGELRARKPGSKDEIEGAVRLARHDVTARIVGAMARTEVDETFVNTTGEELEGVWRFPLPPDARLERLALEVDGKLVEGEFVDASRASGIWRGVIQHAAPGAPRPVEEVVWVPGPWRDPALLEWQRGGRAELKIFPIPRNGSRRVVLAYTQHVSPAAGVRRYVYPLATRGGPAAIDEATFDVQVLGADAGVDVHARGYDLAPREPGATESRGPRLGMTRSPFAPSGDLVVEYATSDRATEASAFGFTPAGGAEDGFVALTLRPRLPSRIAARGRDQVLLVDVGRAMFGERLRRASRLAVTIAQQMDRRDRLTVLACDLECRTLPGGWHAPGAVAAHDVDAFLAGIEAEGASDLVGAVRAAAAVGGRDPGHDLRVVLLSDGAASAGYRSAARVAAEVSDALPDGRAEVVAVPIGSDADVDTLGEIARGGGGAVVPYAPGQPIDAAALDVLAATYGAAMRDVEVILPDGLRDVVPARLATIRAGSETLLAARLHGDRASGDVVLRGKVAGEPFEARWPIEVRATSDEGNAWAARTWAAMRVADDERAGDEASRAESVSLSHRFRVPSRSTSLLVLESETMFHAFGIARAEHTFEWTGENEAQPTETAALDDPADDEKKPDGAGLDGLAARGKTGPAKVAADTAASPTLAAGSGFGGGLADQSTPAAPPAPTATMPMGGASNAGAPILARTAPHASERPARPGRWMRRVWFRTATIAADDRPAVDVTKLESARAALAASPDARQRHAELAKLLVRQGNPAEVEALAARWTERDPLDADALSLRATARAWRGDRDGALRILSGMLASPSLAPAAQSDVASTLARAEERAGRRSRACALRVAAAETKPGDVTAVASALGCERGQGRSASEARWLASMKDDTTRARVSAAAAKLAPGTALSDTVSGDIAVDATWDGSAGVDLDVGIVDPSGRRLSWASAARNVRASDCTSVAHEALAVTSGGTGPFVVEVVRADGASSERPLAGKLRITALGRTQIVPFVLTGTRAQVGRVNVGMDSRLEAITDGWTWGTCDPPFFTDALGVRRMKPGCQ